MALTRLQSALVKADFLRNLLSWDSSNLPAADIPQSRPLLKKHRNAFRRPSSATCQTCSAPVVSHHLDGLLRFQSREFIAPHNQLRVRYVLCLLTPNPLRKRTDLAVGTHSPQRGSYPTKNSPHRQPFRIAAAVAFLLFCVKRMR
jgi:hypothetical protein